jgi:hypothetical protein
VRSAWAESRREELAAALPGWVLARLLVAIGYVIVAAAVDELAGGRATPALDDHLLAWDAAWYEGIAEHGYGGLPAEAVRFFPLFPLLGRGLGWVLLGNTGLAILVIANTAALVAGMLAYRLALEETGDRGLAQRAAWFLALFPGAFVLAWGYAEGLLLVAILGTFLALRRSAWGVVAALAFSAALVRPLGVLLVLPIAWEAWQAWRNDRTPSWRDRWRPAAAAFAAPAGLVSFLAWSAWAGHGFTAPMTEQSPYRGAVTDPLSRLVDAAGDFVGASRLGDLVHPPMAVFAIALTVVVIRRLPARFALYTVPALLLALSAESFNSLERYGLNAVPLVLALAMLTRSPWAERSALVVGASGIVALTALAWVGNYVP